MTATNHVNNAEFGVFIRVVGIFALSEKPVLQLCKQIDNKVVTARRPQEYYTSQAQLSTVQAS